MAKTEKLIGIYRGAGLNAPASNLIQMPSLTGTITEVYLDGPEVSDGDAEFELFEDGVSVTTITIADTTSNENVTGLSFSSTTGKVLSLNLLAPIPAGLPDPPYSLIVTIEVTETHVALTGNQTVAGVKTFSTGPIIPDEAYGVGWNGSLEPPTKNAVYDKIETISGGSVPFTAASSSGAATLEFAEDTDNGTNKVTLQGPASTADVTITLPAAAGTIVLKDSTDTLTNKTIDANGTGNSISNLEVADFAASAIVTAADTIAGNDNDTTIPTSAAVKDYADSVAGGSVTTDSIWDAKGDIAGGTGANTAARLPVGTNGQFLKADSTQTTGLIWDTIPGGGDLLSTNNLNDLADAPTALINLGLTATAAEINTLDGITASTAELNILDGVTASAAELNALDGITATVTELNYTDGVTSAIQTQLDAKAPLSAPTLTNPKLDLDASNASDDTYSGLQLSGRNAASGGLTQFDVVYVNASSEFALADANGSSTYPAIGIAAGTVSGGAAAIAITYGPVRNDAWNFTSVGQPVFLSTTAGGLTQTAPSTSGDKIQVIGIAISADELFVRPSADYYTVT